MLATGLISTRQFLFRKNIQYMWNLPSKNQALTEYDDEGQGTLHAMPIIPMKMKVK